MIFEIGTPLALALRLRPPDAPGTSGTQTRAAAAAGSHVPVDFAQDLRAAKRAAADGSEAATAAKVVKAQTGWHVHCVRPTVLRECQSNRPCFARAARRNTEKAGTIGPASSRLTRTSLFEYLNPSFVILSYILFFIHAS